MSNVNVSTKEFIHTYVQLPSVFPENFKDLRLQAKISLDNIGKVPSGQFSKSNGMGLIGRFS